jgi:membrane fusion protein, multidrug efflux system
MMRFSLSIPLVLVAILISGAAFAQQPGPPPVTVAKPVMKDLIEWDEFTGRFEATAAVDLRARVNGFLDSVHFTDGALVKQGDLLFIIDRRPYQAIVNHAQAVLNAAQTRFDFSKVELERADRLMRSNTISERTLDERRQQYLSAQADVNGARATLDQARLDLGFTEIRAPISGRISRKLVTEGNLVRANDTLLTTLVALDPIYFYFDVDERSFLSYVRMARDGTRNSAGRNGLEVQIALSDEKDFTHKGVMDFIDNRLDFSSGTMRGRAKLDNPQGMLIPGLFGRIQVPGSPTYRAVLIPDEAIGADLDRRFVYVVAADGTLSQKLVRLGSRQDGYRIIRQGLTGDETIIVSGLQRIRFGGGKVTPQMTTLPPAR